MHTWIKTIHCPCSFNKLLVHNYIRWLTFYQKYDRMDRRIEQKRGNYMNFKIFKTYEEASKFAADYIATALKDKKNSVLGLATGSSPEGMYKELISMYKNGDVDFSKVHSVNLDEYVGLEGTHPQSYRYFMNDRLFDHVNIDLQNTRVPNGVAKDLEEEAKAYTKMVESLGAIDVQVLGIGPNGHIGFNEPGEKLTVNTHVADLTEGTIEANARFFDSKDEVPTKALTMGTAQIMKAKKILLIASGENKAWAVKQLTTEEITTCLLYTSPSPRD